MTNAHATMKLLTMRTKVEKKNIIISADTNFHSENELFVKK